MTTITLQPRRTINPSHHARLIYTKVREMLMGLAADDKIETLFELDSLLQEARREYHEDAQNAGLLMPGFDD